MQYIELLEEEVKRLRQQLDKQPQQQQLQQQLQQQSGQPKLPPPGSAPQQETATAVTGPNGMAKDHRQLPVPFNAAQHALQASCRAV